MLLIYIEYIQRHICAHKVKNKKIKVKFARAIPVFDVEFGSYL